MPIGVIMTASCDWASVQPEFPVQSPILVPLPTAYKGTFPSPNLFLPDPYVVILPNHTIFKPMSNILSDLFNNNKKKS